MGIFLGLFLYGCLVAATVAVGLVFAMSAAGPDGPGAVEGKPEEIEAS